MAKPSFTSVLDQLPDEIERPKPLPPGDYVVVIKDYIQDKSSLKETKYVEFQTYPTEAMENVDEEWLSDSLTRVGGEKKRLNDVLIRVRFYDTPEAGYRLKKFLLDDVQLDNDGRSIGQLTDAAKGAQVIVHLKHRNVDGEIFVDVKGTSPVNAPTPKKLSARR